MRNILVLGAGRSSSALISHLLETATSGGWMVTVGDVSFGAALEKINNHPRGRAITFDIHAAEADDIIRNHDVVISLLPAHLHPMVAGKCLAYKKHMLNASYVSPELKAMDREARDRGVLFLSECGLDPGIDHMSAVQVIDRIRQSGGKIISFESFTGGLIAPDTDPDNPWRYKFTWNPRNVVMAGQGTAKYLSNGKYRYIPYQQLFARTTPVVVEGYGEYEGYANRDSLGYIETYGLKNIRTMLRGTLRNKGFCSAWNVLVQLGCCDDTYQIDGAGTMSHRDFIESFLDDNLGGTAEDKISTHFGLRRDGPELKRLVWSGLFSGEKIGLPGGTPAQILEHILNKKWRLHNDDKDQIVMWHRFRYMQDGREGEIQATLVATGEDSVNTAMAKTVGLPLALAAGLIMNGKIQARGVQIPITSEFYTPILSGLKTLGVELTEKRIG